ncbi:MAG: hypothetical protein HYV07_09680 [Deltaproteobacteria bacterium]|nr:hypothetical protein [Deltaproteobacteria bacterium]
MSQLDPPNPAVCVGAAAAEASHGLAARAARMVEAAEEIYRTPSPDRGEAFSLKLEGLAREIDASFPRDALPEELARVRERIVAELGLGGR